MDSAPEHFLYNKHWPYPPASTPLKACGAYANRRAFPFQISLKSGEICCQLKESFPSFGIYPKKLLPICEPKIFLIRESLI